MRKQKTVLPPGPPYTIQEYEKSLYWKLKSKRLLLNKETECEICHRKRWKYLERKKKWKRVLRFVVHHITYENVPNEKPEDMQILCWQCHDISHLILRLENLGKFYQELAKIVRKFFKYKPETHTQHNAQAKSMMEQKQQEAVDGK